MHTGMDPLTVLFLSCFAVSAPRECFGWHQAVSLEMRSVMSPSQVCTRHAWLYP